MRPIARPQSALRTPLNSVLGAEASVRILRVLSHSSVPMAPSELASKAMINLSGALRAISALEELGIIERVGTGGRKPVVLRREHPLAGNLESLFAAERARFEHILDRLKELVSQLSPPPKSAWIEGPVATDEDTLGAPLRLALLARAKDVDQHVSAIQANSFSIQKQLDVTVEARGLTDADLAAMPPKEIEQLTRVLPLFGPPPGFFLGGWERVSARRSHAELDEDSRALAAAIATQLKRDPSIVTRAKQYVQARLQTASAGERRELREWDALLRSTSAPRLRQFLVDPGARATRLRQTMPFLAILTPEEQANVHLDVALARRKAKRTS